MTIFDIVTVGCFLAMVVAYFKLGDADQRLIPHLLLSGVAFAVANQLGNHGRPLLAILLIVAGAGYAALQFRR